ncbi:hypothetical protein [Sinosporangium siamense]|uniref:DivIVA domain-containing protein n=1 Tax=Sinosporangium siamense TaxID=1367973 RepID=A0A919RFS7_9ACTN|nr:hypothetical protein [Sinosporangium siamense]GII93096.1 hypothetical protein Ssi02_33270 [Sinosporangium siamense]
MVVVLVLAALAVLACVVLVAQGRAGELTEFAPDVPPVDLPEAKRLAPVDFMALRLPVSLVGYHTQSVDETLHRAAAAIGERDTKIAVLEQRIAELLSTRLRNRQEIHARPGTDPRTMHEPTIPARENGTLRELGGPVGAEKPKDAVTTEVTEELAGPAAVPADKKVAGSEDAVTVEGTKEPAAPAAVPVDKKDAVTSEVTEELAAPAALPADKKIAGSADKPIEDKPAAVPAEEKAAEPVEKDASSEDKDPEAKAPEDDKPGDSEPKR